MAVPPIRDGAPKVHHYPISSPAPESTNPTQATVRHQNRRLLLSTSFGLPNVLSGLRRPISPAFSIFSLFSFPNSHFLALVKPINFEFRRKIRFNLNPNFRLYKKSRQINNSW
jgi:hypothetical protein